jgi:DNA helicase II / ATP-dependent DNA helicase PcrA
MVVALNPEQQAAVEHGDGPLLVLAGAGTGKTRVLVHRIARLLEGGVAPWEILAVTFTNKAAREMRERLLVLCGPVTARMWIGTFHATCARLLRRWGEAVGLTRDFLIFDDDDQHKIINSLIKEAGYEDQISARTIAARLDYAGNRGIDPITANAGPGGDFATEFLHVIVPRYRERLAREKAVDFAGLILKMLDLCRHPDIGPRLAGQYRHVLVDEFQDTNLVQYELVRHLASITRNLTVVGDDDQSIYAWRGAEPRNLLDFDRDFPDVVEIKLEQNYRSTAVILDAANAVIGKNLDRRGKALWTQAAAGDPIAYLACGDDRGEAETVARTLRGMVDDGACSPGDVCFLYRTNAQSRPLEEQLRRFRFTPKVVGATAFYDRREVKDAIAYLRLLANPDADTAFERIVNTPPRGIGAATIERLRDYARADNLGLLVAARTVARGGSGLGPGPRKKLAAFVEMFDGLAAVRDGGASLAELLIQVVERTGYRQFVEQDDGDGADRMRNLAELVNVASDYSAEVGDDDDGSAPAATAPGDRADEDEAASAARGLAGFLERISLVGAADGADGRGETVTLMTIHMAKGLEFDVVFLCGMEDGLFPSLRPRDDMDEASALEEERRLAYVALTRAKRQLFVSSARLRRVWGELKQQTPSRFLDDIPSGCFAVPRRSTPSPIREVALVRPAITRRRPTDDFDQRSWDDDVPVFRTDADLHDHGGFAPGTVVRHQSFGQGRVVSAHGNGSMQRVVVEFADLDSTMAITKTIDARWLQRAS